MENNVLHLGILRSMNQIRLVTLIPCNVKIFDAGKYAKFDNYLITH